MTEKRYLAYLLLAAGFGMACVALAHGEAAIVARRAVMLCLKRMGL